MTRRRQYVVVAVIALVAGYGTAMAITRWLPDSLVEKVGTVTPQTLHPPVVASLRSVPG